MLLEHLVERQVLSHGARTRRADEENDRRHGPGMHPAEQGVMAEQFQALHLEHDLLTDYVAEVKQKQQAYQRQIRLEETGPMYIWEALADRLYKMVA